VESFNHLLAMIKKEYIVFTRYPIRVLEMLITPIFLVLIFTFTSRAFMKDPTNEQLQSLATFMYLGILIYSYLSVTTNSAQAIRDEQFQGTLESLFLTPSKKYLSVLARIIIQNGLVTFNVVILYFTLSLTIFPLKLANIGLGLFLFFMLLLQFVGIGLIIASLTIKYKETIVVVSGFLLLMMMIFSAIFFSFQSIQFPIITTIGRLLPTSYTIDAIRSTFLDYPSGFPELASIIDEIVIAITSAAFLVFLGIYNFVRVERNARRSGILLEY